MRPWSLVFAGLLLGLHPAWGQVQRSPQSPSQLPLINRTGTGVKPNVMLMLDDSGSMSFQHMPEGSILLGKYMVSSPLGGLSVVFHPDDVGPQASASLSNFYVVASNRNTNSWAQKLMRSPDGNSIYYNPAIRYQPWVRADGTRYPNASITAASVDPDANKGKVDLTRSLSQRSAYWILLTGSDIPWANVAQDFEPGLYYRLRKGPGGDFLHPQVASNYDLYSVNQAPATPKAPGRTDCAAATCTLAEEQQNFANWFVYYRSRLLLAKAAIGEVLAFADNSLRLGYGRIGALPKTVDGIPGIAAVESGVRDFDATRKADVMRWLYALPPGGGTPLRTAVRGVGNYFMSRSDKGPWSDLPGTGSSAPHQACRRTYEILVTDGYWNDIVGSLSLPPVGNVDGTDGAKITGADGRAYTYSAQAPYRDTQLDTLADYAMLYWKQDLRPDLDNRVPPTADNPAFWQSLTTFAVGLGVRGTLDPKTSLPGLVQGTLNWSFDRIDDLWHAALNTRGQYFSAQDPVDLRLAIDRSLRSMLERELHDAGVATASASLDTANRRFVPRYRSGSWSGDVDAYSLDASGQAGPKAWSASAGVPPWTERNILAWDRGQSPAPRAVPFRWKSLSDSARAAVAADRGEALVNYLRGDRSGETGDGGLRTRSGVLGDFINSPPVFAGTSSEPSNLLLPGEGGSYQGYLNTVKAVRPGVLWVGANDGMLHAFQDGGSASGGGQGTEVFAYVPGVLLPQVAVLADRSYGLATLPHRFFVDGVLREADVFVPAPDATAASWRNYLFGTLGAGGKGVFALDITDPARLDAGAVRWEIGAAQAASLGYQRFAIQGARLPNGKWVAVFGNGSLSADGSARLMVVDIASGKLQTLAVDTAGGNGLGGVALAKDASGQVVALYAGDLKGNLWRFDYAASTDSGFVLGNNGQALFSVPSGQPIVQAPVVSAHSKGGRLVVFGTGQMLTDDDATATSMQAVYALQDKPGETLSRPFTVNQLEQRTLSSLKGGEQAAGQVWIEVAGGAIDWTQRRGWYANLDLAGYAGLRVAYGLQALGSGYVFVSAIAPGQAVGSCDSSDGKGINLLLPAETGLPSDAPVFDTDGNGVFDTHDRAKVLGYGTAADGVDAVVSGASASGATRVSLQSASGKMDALLPSSPLASPPATTPSITLHDYRWRRLVNPPL